MKSIRCLSLMLGWLLSASLMIWAQEARLLRFPAIHGNQIVFTYVGDLYSVPASGGTARKLTNDKGFEMFARFSPDGKQLAFTGQYDGNTEIYLMPAEGGVPGRLTYTATLERDDVSDRMGPNNIVMGWKGNDRIIYRSKQTQWNEWKGQLLTVSREGGPSELLPLPRGGFCSFSPDGKKLAYNRVFREFRTWKRYRGGQADDVWIYDFDSKSTVNVTNNPAQDIFPMWGGNRIYFLSDRDENKKMNLFVYELDSKKTRQLTRFTQYDVKFPSLGDKAIVFENGGYIHKFDLASEKVEKVPIQLNEDFVSGRGGLIDVSRMITNYEIAPDGNRALFGARGDVFTVPAKYGSTRNLTQTSGIHERNAVWSPDGKWIAFISDASGEDEIYLTAQDGSGEPRQLTSGADTYKYMLSWSPDSRKILWSDKKQRLQFVEVESKSVTQVAQPRQWEIIDYSWSPDSQWIAYSQPEEKKMATIYLYSLEKKESVPVTDGWFDSTGVTFSQNGKYLFFISERNFAPAFSQVEFNVAYQDMAKLYLVALAKDVKSPFALKSDEVTIKEPSKESAKPETKPEEKEAKTPVAVKVDLDGLQSRIAEIPVPGGNYRHLVSVENSLYYQRRRSVDEKPKLLFYDLEKQKETELGEFQGYEISTNGKKMLVQQEQSYAILDLPTAKIEVKEKLDLGGLKVNVDRKAEWSQIFHESWRQMRDFFYAPNLHGVDWPRVRENYAALLPYVNHRADLTYLIGEMIGELNAGHAYVGGGDLPRPERIPMGLLGAELERDPATGFFRITKILPGQNWDKNLRSPLTEMGVTAHEGDYVLAVNGKTTSKMKDLYEALVNTAGKQVQLTLNDKPREEGKRETVVAPIADEKPLRYYNWVRENIAKVDKATEGRVGYLHIPDMGLPGLNQFTKLYYPQLRKEALIVDVRGNAGGNVSPIVIERLRREMAMIDIARNGLPNPDPGGLVPGPKVCLMDEFSASDGDIFPYRFRQYKLGQLIGKRSWGGVVGIRGTLPFVDGGVLNRPEFSRYDLAGKEWIMEGHGVDPDIVVDNDPAREFAGTDDQLNKAIEVILAELKKNPVRIAPPPPYPDKAK